MAGVVRLERATFAVRGKKDKLTGRPILAPTMEFVVECEGKRITKKVVLYLNEGSSVWSYSYDMREAVGYLVYGSTSGRPSSKESKDHFNYATDRLYREIRAKLRRFSRRKDVVGRLEEADKKSARVAMIGELQTFLDRFVRGHPELRKQDVVACYEKARNRETVRHVMES